MGQGRDELMVSLIWHSVRKMRWCGGDSEEVEGVGLEQLSLLLDHAFTLRDDASAH